MVKLVYNSHVYRDLFYQVFFEEDNSISSIDLPLTPSMMAPNRVLVPLTEIICNIMNYTFFAKS